jgi:hypothetical protein
MYKNTLWVLLKGSAADVLILSPDPFRLLHTVNFQSMIISFLLSGVVLVKSNAVTICRVLISDFSLLFVVLFIYLE